MAFSIGAISGLVDFDTRPMAKSLGSAQKQVKDFGRDVADAGKSAGGDFFKELNAQFGKRSTLGLSGKLLAGGGVIGGLAFGLSKVNEMVASATKLKDQFEEGSIGAGAMAEQMVKTLPIIGQVYGISRNIAELINGDEAALKRINEHVARMGASMQEVKQIVALDLSGVTGAKSAAKAHEQLDAIAKAVELTHKQYELQGKIVELQGRVRDEGPSHASPLIRGTFLDFNRAAADAENLKSVQEELRQVNIEVKALTDKAKEIDQLKFEGLSGFTEIGKWLAGGAKQVGKEFLGEAAKRVSTLAKSMAAMRDELDKAGLEDWQKRLMDFSKLPGVNSQQIAQAKKMLMAVQEASNPDLFDTTNLSELTGGVTGRQSGRGGSAAAPLLSTNSQDYFRLRAQLILANDQDPMSKQSLATEKEQLITLKKIEKNLKFPVSDL